MPEQRDAIVTLEVPFADSPDDVTDFVRQLQQSFRADGGVRLELEVVGRRRYLHLVRVPVGVCLPLSVPIERHGGPFWAPQGGPNYFVYTF